MADAAPTRRSSRLTSAPAAPEAQGVLTRAELRRRAAAAVAVVPAVPVQAVTDEAHVADAHVADERVAPGTTFAAEPEPCHLDEFEFAARLFSFTGETPIQRVDDNAAPTTVPEPVAAAPLHVAPRRPRRMSAAFQRVAAASFSIGVMAIVGLLAVGTTTPAAAVAGASTLTTDITATETGTDAKTPEIQAFVSNGTDNLASLDRPENYNVASMADIAAASGVTEFAGTWVNDPSAAIQWPFPVGVPISAAFGSSTYLSQFSSPHRGVDLTPGEGAEIHVIAAGTVRIATEAGGDYGVTVVVDHIVDGQLVSTRYGHMLRGSLDVEVGETVTAGEVIGKVGQTGKATGPHLHFEVLLGGTAQIDPMPWMYEHTKGTHTVG